MQLRIFTSLVTVFQFFIAFSFGNDFVIYRNRSLLNQIWESWDSFRIPSSTCQQTTQGDRCVPFVADIDSKRNCSCLCQSAHTSTFVFHEGQWTCLENFRVRDLHGDLCGNTHYLLPELDHLPDPALSALSVGDVIPTDILHGLGIQHCDVNPNSSWYLGCNGMPLYSSQHLRKIGELFAFKFNSTASSNYFVLEVKRGVQNTELLQGRVINLGILCNESRGHQYHGCIQIKLMGKLTCPEMVPNLQPSSSAMPKNTSIRAVSTSSKMGLTTSIIVSASSSGSNSSKPTSTTSIIASANSTGIHPTSTVFRPTLMATQIFSNPSQTILVARHTATRSTTLQSSLVSASTTESVSSKRNHITTIIASTTWTVIRLTSIMIRPPTIPARIFSSPSQTRLKLSFARSVVSLPSANHPTSKVNRTSSIDTRIMSSTLHTSLIFHTITRPRVLHQSTFVLPSNVHLRPSPNVEGDAKGSSSSLGFITGISISISLAVVMIGIIGLIFYLRYFRGKWHHEQKDHRNTVMMSIHRNSAFQEDDDNENNSLAIRPNVMRTISSRQISQSSPDETDVGYMMMKEPSCPERTYDYAYANPVQSFSAETDTGYVMMNGASCPERTYDYAYANPVEMTPPSLISRSTRTVCVPADQQSPSVEVRSPAIYIDKNYEDTKNINAENSLFTEGTVSSPISQSCPEKPETGYMTMEGSPCSSSAYDYAYAKTSKLTRRILVSRAGMKCDKISTEYFGENTSRNQQQSPSDEFRSSAIYTDKDYKNAEVTCVKNSLFYQRANDERLQVDCGASALSYENFPGSSSGHFAEERTDPEKYVEMGKRRGVRFADSEDKNGRNGLSKEEEEGPGNLVLVETGKLRSSASSPDKHYENISAKNNSSNEGENDGRLRLDCRACGLSYENLPGSRTSHFSAERTNPEEYVEMGKRRSVQLADSRGEPGLHGFPCRH